MYGKKFSSVNFAHGEPFRAMFLRGPVFAMIFLTRHVCGSFGWLM